MAALRYGTVLFKGASAGTLREEPHGGTRFAYDDAWLQAGGPRIAECFPTAAGPFVRDRGLHPFFEHLTPEGWLREAQARVGGLDPQDDFGLLLRYGADCIGAVSVTDPVPAGQTPATGDLEPDVRDAIEGGRTVSGVQRKLLVTETASGVRPARPNEPAPVIAKLPSEGLPDIVANETVTLAACRLILGTSEVAEARRGFVEGRPEPVLLVRRFDRTAGGAPLRLEDFAQILVRPRGLDFSGKYDGAYEECADVLRDHSARPVIDVARLFRRIVVFAVLGNTDAHLKNFSLLETADGMRLSPCYDVVNTVAYAREGYSTRFGLRLGGAYRQHDAIDRDMLVAFGEAIGLPARAVNRVFADLERRGDRLFRLLADDNPLPGERKDIYIDIVRSAWLRIVTP